MSRQKVSFEEDFDENELYEKDFFFYFNYLNERNSVKTRKSNNFLVDNILGKLNDKNLMQDDRVIIL